MGGNKKSPFVFFAPPLGFGFIRNGYTCWSLPEALGMVTPAGASLKRLPWLLLLAAAVT